MNRSSLKDTAPVTSSESESATQPVQPHPSAMRLRFNAVAEFVARTVFSRVVVNEAAVAKIRELASRGTVIYALRNRSLVDYFLINYVLRREGLPLAVYANGISAVPLAPLRDMLATVRDRIRQAFGRAAPESPELDHDYCARAVSEGKPVLIFMRGRRTRGVFGRWMRRPVSSRVGTDFFREIVQTYGEDERERFIVPMALFRGHSFHRRATGISALVYSVHEVPNDARKLLTYFWNRAALFITVGKEVALGEFRARYSQDTQERVIRRLTRAIQIFLHREERVVLGPALLPRRQIKALVLENTEITDGIRRLAQETGTSVGKLRKEAESYFEEMAADFNGILFAVVAYIFKKVWGRMFTGLKPIGFEPVVEKVRNHPVVLVPCHRSHFDYLIITYLFHLHFVSPPHIAAGVNMAFWPMGPFFRASGAYFIRRSFADNELYKLVFKQYLTFLIREGYTQEFFIEGGRSRTGKIMTPKLGMLSAIVNAFLGGIRRDLYLVPVSIHYGRIVEEEAYGRELTGAEKERESFQGLLRARRFLKQKFGTAYLSFAEPVSLNEVLGDRKQRFVEGAGVPEIEDEKRRFIQRLGFRLLREVNDCSVAGATSISSTVLLAAPRGGKRYRDYAEQANALTRLVLQQRVIPTESLERNIGDFRESLSFLASSGLIDTIHRGSEEILVVRDNKRLALDFYKNNLIHIFVVPSLVTYCLVAETPAERRVDHIWWWLDLFRWEFALPPRDQLPVLVEAYIAYLRSVGAWNENGVDGSNPLVRATLPILDNFREAYWAAARSVRDLVGRDGISEKSLIEEHRKSYHASLLLGEVLRPEGGTTVLFHNALNRFAELGLTVTKSPVRRRTRVDRRGPSAGRHPRPAAGDVTC
jgi:glycerol-3-phosphate O-acyltransferase